MKGRESKGPPSTDLLVCFPSRAHLSLMPKPICSPARPSSELNNKRHQNHPKKSSPLLWVKTKQMSSDIISEPTSPKVTCAGQIKVRPRSSNNPCKNWQSVMEEIERMHNNRKQRKKPNWVKAFGFKKDVMQFLTCLRSIRFDFRCFGSFPTSDVTSDDAEEDEEEEEEEEDEDEDYQENRTGQDGGDECDASRTVFSKWFMVLQENQNSDFIKKQSKETETSYNNNQGFIQKPCAPPSNALLLMRCRSAPAKSWLEEREEEDDNDDDEEEEEEEEEGKKEEEEEEEERKETGHLVVMRYGSDFDNFSCDIAKETWVVGGNRDPLSRSRSWKR